MGASQQLDRLASPLPQRRGVEVREVPVAEILEQHPALALAHSVQIGHRQAVAPQEVGDGDERDGHTGVAQGRWEERRVLGTRVHEHGSALVGQEHSPVAAASGTSAQSDRLRHC